jgi:hypothetical protein
MCVGAGVRRFCLVALLGAIAGSGSAFAALGGDLRSVESDAAHLAARAQSTTTPSYTVQEIETPSGNTVREYVADGKVFAVAWKGAWPPDLRQLLGSYFPAYQQAAAAAKLRAGRTGLVSIRQRNLVVERAGHMRSFSGRAYLTDQWPAGVSPESVR